MGAGKKKTSKTGRVRMTADDLSVIQTEIEESQDVVFEDQYLERLFNYADACGEALLEASKLIEPDHPHQTVIRKLLEEAEQ